VALREERDEKHGQRDERGGRGQTTSDTRCFF
jgi:hypothetical protein